MQNFDCPEYTGRLMFVLSTDQQIDSFLIRPLIDRNRFNVRVYRKLRLKSQRLIALQRMTHVFKITAILLPLVS